ncbi:hypothetical protein [Nigerium massiliense]|uniref:hypothetical protein n=1 Tax=Nigerium massiliense TaxID=1522317 RepID=UPI0012FDF5F8|nr:hypothetical protein [Nigerium massiliense]
MGGSVGVCPGWLVLGPVALGDVPGPGAVVGSVGAGGTTTTGGGAGGAGAAWVRWSASG